MGDESKPELDPPYLTAQAMRAADDRGLEPGLRGVFAQGFMAGQRHERAGYRAALVARVTEALKVVG